MDLILDIQEKETAKVEAPTFPQLKSSTSGFPEHKKRTRVSAFKQQRQGTKSESKNRDVFSTGSEGPLVADDHDTHQERVSPQAPPQSSMKETIDRENNERISSMSPQEIEKARQELFNGLDPKILEMLLKRPNLDEKHEPSPFDVTLPQLATPPEIKVEDTSHAKRTVRFQDVPDESTDVNTDVKAPISQTTSRDHNDLTPTIPPEKQIESVEPSSSSKPHWPQPPVTPDIDPDDPNFLATLHEKYFPNLPADPSKMAWMAPIPTPNSPADYDSPYHPSQDSLPISQLRFDFRGTLLPPRISRAVPMSKGLHHHGEAPEAAGYTVAELARLARSSVPAQRCIAYQTLGRVLYRLGRAEYGSVNDDVPKGIWGSVVEGGVMESLYEEAGVDPEGKGDGKGKGHRSAHAFAVEAIWLYEKAGWKEKAKKAK